MVGNRIVFTVERMLSMNEPQFKLPKGYAVWCHICGKEPFNKMMAVEVEDHPGRFTTIPGLGFKTMEEAQQHEVEIHRVWKG